MKTKYTIGKCLALMVLVGSAFFSCSDYLNNELHNATYVDKFWKTSIDANSGVAGAYTLYRRALLNGPAFVYWADCPAGFLMNETWNTKAVTESGNFRISYLEDQTTNWQGWYQIVQQCNLIIDQVPKIPLEKFKDSHLRDEYTGEGYFMRALSYFYMTRVWGDLPYEVDPIYTAEQISVKGQVSDTAIMNLIISDARQASSLLAWGSVQDSRTRANKGTALALLAHAYAWKGDYQKTLLYTDSIINKSPAGFYVLENGENVRNVFSPKFTSMENIFFLPQRLANKEQTSTGMGSDLTLKEPYLKGKTSNPPLRPIQSKLNEYFTDKNDKRLNQFFGLLNTTAPILIKYSDIDYENKVEFTNPYCESNMVIFRLADMILLRAEAMFFTGNEAGAREQVNIIRTRAGITPLDASYSSTLLQKEILNERFRELAGEGHNYYDQLRMKIYPAWLNGNRLSQAMRGWLWPIHDNILNNNHLVNQNEWWKSH